MCSENINLPFLGSILIPKCDKKSIPMMSFNVSAMQNSQFKGTGPPRSIVIFLQPNVGTELPLTADN